MTLEVLVDYFSTKESAGNQEQLYVRSNCAIPSYMGTQRIPLEYIVHALEMIGRDKVEWIHNKVMDSPGKTSLILPNSWIRDILTELEKMTDNSRLSSKKK